MHPNTTEVPRLGLLQSFVPDFSRMAAPLPETGVDYLSYANEDDEAPTTDDGEAGYPFPEPPDEALSRGLLSGWLEEAVVP